jgi:Tfp pilus assembly protein PilO
VTRRVVLFGSLVFVLVIAGWYVALLKPEKHQFHVQQGRVATALTTRRELVARLAGLEALAKGLPADERALAKTVPAIPTTDSVDTVIDQINQVALATGVQWTEESQSIGSGTTAGSTSTSSSAQTPTSGTATAGLSTLSMTLSVTGSYQAVTSFVTLLQHRPRLLVVDSLTFDPSAQSVTATIGARAFYDTTPLPKLSGLASATTLTAANG